MFEVDLVQADSAGKERLGLFRKIIEALTEVAGDERIKIKASDKGLYIQVMDQMRVALADVFLGMDIFPYYRCDREIQLGLPSKQFATILRNISPVGNDIVKIYADDMPQILTVKHTFEDGEFTYNISLCEVDKDDYTIPKQEYSCSIKILAEKFRNGTKLIGQFGEYIQMSCEKDFFNMKQCSEILNNDMKLINNDKIVLINSTEPVSVEIAMKYVNIINKICFLTDTVNIYLSKTAPVFFDFKLFEHSGYIKFYIAPKIDQ